MPGQLDAPESSGQVQNNFWLNSYRKKLFLLICLLCFAPFLHAATFVTSSLINTKVQLPCDISPPTSDDQMLLVLWYKDDQVRQRLFRGLTFSLTFCFYSPTSWLPYSRWMDVKVSILSEQYSTSFGNLKLQNHNLCTTLELAKSWIHGFVYIN